MALSHLTDAAIGIDGCKGGWFAFIKSAKQISYLQTTSLASLLALMNFNATVFIDMPIGLPDPSAPVRACDKLARQYLPGRSSSVFPVPCREALYAKDYLTACDINQCYLGKRLPIQTWNITPKIRELEQMLDCNQLDNPFKHSFYESHPELLFAGLAGHPMRFSKATAEGRAERLHHLAQWAKSDYPVLLQALEDTPKKVAKADDIIDAFILMVAAAYEQKHWQFLPPQQDKDLAGKLKQIVFIPKL